MRCRSCLSDKITDVLDLGDQYLSEFNTKGDPKPESHPLHLVMCEECSLVQLDKTVPFSKLYGDGYGYYSNISNTIRQDLHSVVDQALKRKELQIGDVVVDIGSNDGTLLKNYPDKVVRIGFDPVSKFGEFYKGQNLLFANHYFESLIYYHIVDKPAKIITCVSMFYDLDDPNAFVKSLRECLAEDGLLVIQQNYVAGMLQQHAFDNIVHEHLEYYSLKSMEHLLLRHGLEVVDVETSDVNGGSFRLYVRHMSRLRKMRLLEQKMRLTQKGTYLIFGMKVKQIATKLNKFIKEEVAKGKTVYVYGASTRGNTLLQACGLDNKLIKAAVERNPVKFGKQIASLEIPIISEEQAEKDKFDYALFLPWFFKTEFLERYKHLRGKGVKFIFPLPEVEVI